MQSTKYYVLAMSVVYLVSIYPQTNVFAAEKPVTFKSSEFLAWKRESQEFYLRTSIGMAGLIASRNDKEQGDCLESWYFDDEKAANDSILDVMRQYPDFHPRGVIAAVMERRCGPLDYSKR